MTLSFGGGGFAFWQGYAFGLTGPGGYLTSNWCRLDLLIVVTSWLWVVLEEYASTQDIDLIRMVRAIRALRIISRSPGIQVEMCSGGAGEVGSRG